MEQSIIQKNNVTMLHPKWKGKKNKVMNE